MIAGRRQRRGGDGDAWKDISARGPFRRERRLQRRAVKVVEGGVGFFAVPGGVADDEDAALGAGVGGDSKVEPAAGAVAGVEAALLSPALAQPEEGEDGREADEEPVRYAHGDR